MSTPERQDDPGGYGYGGVEQEKDGEPDDAGPTEGTDGSGEGVPEDESPPEDVQAG
jgi:hypothetical protein